MRDEPTHLDLFSGIGGFAIAAQAAGWRTVGFCEIDGFAQSILAERFGAVVADGIGLRELQPQGGASAKSWDGLDTAAKLWPPPSTQA